MLPSDDDDIVIPNPMGEFTRNLFKSAEDLRYRLRSMPNTLANKMVDQDRGRFQRPLTSGEKQAVVEAFGYEVAPDAVRVVDGPGLSPIARCAFKIGGNPAITVGNTIFVRHDLYVIDMTRQPDHFDRLLHEYTHVIQYYRLGFGTFLGRYTSNSARYPLDRSKAYKYEERKTSFDQETIEGQAEMVGNYARLKRFGNPVDKDKVADIARRLKGTGIYDL